MQKRVSRADVARAAGVSTTTVTFVTTGRRDVGISEDTRARVLRVAKELGYRPHRIAQSLRTGHTNMIGVWLGSLGEPFDTTIIDHLHQALADSGYEMLIAHARVADDWRARLDRFCAWPVDGVLAVNAETYVDELYDRGAAPTMPPVVALGGFCSSRPDRVLLDMGSGARLAMQHLVSSGRRRLAYVVRSEGNGPHEARYVEYLAAMARAGFDPEILCVPQGKSAQTRYAAYRVVREYVAARRPAEGLFCYSDDIAIGVLRALLDVGLRVPEDVAVVGHDGILETDFVQPRLTTVAYPMARMCELAWEYLQRRMADSDLPRQDVALLPELIVRQSS